MHIYLDVECRKREWCPAKGMTFASHHYIDSVILQPYVIDSTASVVYADFYSNAIITHQGITILTTAEPGEKVALTTYLKRNYSKRDTLTAWFVCGQVILSFSNGMILCLISQDYIITELFAMRLNHEVRLFSEFFFKTKIPEMDSCAWIVQT